MTSQVSLPLWLALIVSALAIWAAVDRILIPAVRWFMRRRFNRTIDELNTRLKLRIQPFKLAKRQALIDQLIFDPDVLRAIEDYATANKVSREVAQARARHYAQEIVPSFSAYAYFGIGTRLARWVSTFIYRVRLGYMDEEAMKTVDPDAAVIFVINHRSNMDYVLVTYMASTSSALSYAVGAWTGKRVAAIGVGAAVVVLGYLADSFLPQIESLKWTEALSPFDWYLGGEPLVNGVRPGDAALLLGLAVLLVALGTWRFNQRDVAV